MEVLDQRELVRLLVGRVPLDRGDAVNQNLDLSALGAAALRAVGCRDEDDDFGEDEPEADDAAGEEPEPSDDDDTAPSGGDVQTAGRTIGRPSSTASKWLRSEMGSRAATIFVGSEQLRLSSGKPPVSQLEPLF
jgi:hypothetical protein